MVNIIYSQGIPLVFTFWFGSTKKNVSEYNRHLVAILTTILPLIHDVTSM